MRFKSLMTEGFWTPQFDFEIAHRKKTIAVENENSATSALAS
jgi:hypothetical protein